MKKVLVLGSKGMAGHVIAKSLPQLGKYEVYRLARHPEEDEYSINLDVKNVDKLQEIIVAKKFDVIINCIGVLNKDAEDHPEKAIWFNSYFPHYLEAVTKNTETKIIHISTDCVFSGKRGEYTENDIKDGQGFYAKSKSLGEIDNSKDVTIRTSIIGPELNKNGIGLFNWFMSQSINAELKGFSRAYWSGITTIELTKVINEVINQKISGIIQVTKPDKIDKYNLLRLFNKIFRNNLLTIRENPDYAVDKSMISIRSDFHYILPPYEIMLAEMKDWVDNNNYDY